MQIPDPPTYAGDELRDERIYKCFYKCLTSSIDSMTKEMNEWYRKFMGNLYHDVFYKCRRTCKVPKVYDIDVGDKNCVTRGF